MTGYKDALADAREAFKSGRSHEALTILATACEQASPNGPSPDQRFTMQMAQHSIVMRLRWEPGEDVEALNDRALSLEKEIAAYLERLPEHDEQASQHWSALGESAFSFDRFGDARRHYTEALRVWPSHGDKTDQGRIHAVWMLVESLHRLGELADAKRLGQRNYDAARTADVIYTLRISTAVSLGQVLLKQGDGASARPLFLEALEIAHAHGNHSFDAEFHGYISSCDSTT